MLVSVGLLSLVGVGATSAADLAPSGYATKSPAIRDPVYNWTGFYVGANAGGAWDRSSPSTTTVSSPIGYFPPVSIGDIALGGAQRINGSGFTGGLTTGYNWQVSSAVFGLEADFNYFGVKGSTSSTTAYTCCVPTTFTINSSTSSDWLITLRPRAGFLATPQFLLYGTGGLAVANLKANFLFTDTFAGATESASISTTRVGWTVGGGGEYALLNGWSIKAEYLYVDLGRANATSTNLTLLGVFASPANVFTHSTDLRSNIGRIGLNYKFGGPVVAKY